MQVSNDGNIIQLNAFITQSRIVRYYINDYRNWGRISIRCCIYIRHPIPRPNGRAMVCLLWIFMRKLTTLLWHCIMIQIEWAFHFAVLKIMIQLSQKIAHNMTTVQVWNKHIYFFADFYNGESISIFGFSVLWHILIQSQSSPHAPNGIMDSLSFALLGPIH